MPVSTPTKRTAIQRYLKPEVLKQKGAWPREMKLINDLTAIYPDETFWVKHTLDFSLNSLAWFKTADGAATLKADYATFHLVLDTPAPVVYNEGTPGEVSAPLALPPVKPRTISDLLS